MKTFRQRFEPTGGWPRSSQKKNKRRDERRTFRLRNESDDIRQARRPSRPSGLARGVVILVGLWLSLIAIAVVSVLLGLLVQLISPSG